MNISFEQAHMLVINTLKAGLVPNLLGSPGVGKSDLIKGIAKEFKLCLIDFRLAQADPTDLGGFPTLNEERTRSHYAAPSTFPLVDDPIPEGYEGWLLFFDEMPAAPQLVQAAAYKIILDRMVGNAKLHPRVMMACAGNLATDRAIVNRASTAMQSRLIHFNLDVNLDDWIKWALQNNIDHRVIGFLRFRPELLHNFDPKHSDNTFPCPRTWHFVSKLITKLPKITFNELPLIMGAVGKGAAVEFNAFCEFYTQIPTIEQMLQSPKSVTIPTEPSLLYAISSLISNKATKTNIDNLIQVIERLPTEFQFITLRSILQIDLTMLKVPAITAWVSANACELV